MGWARTLFLGDIGNRLDIADAERDIGHLKDAFHEARHENVSQDEQIAQLRFENQQLELCVAALVKTLQRKGVLEDREVQNLTDMIEGLGDA